MSVRGVLHRLRGATLPALLVALTAGAAVAADLEFSASVDRTTVGVGEQFQLVLTVRGEGMSSVPAPALASAPDFDLLGSSSSQSTNISIVNGQMKREATIDFVFVMAAKKTGKLVIPPSRITYQGKTYESQAIEMTVVKEAQGRANPMPTVSGTPAPANVPIEGNVFLSVTPARRTVYVGEPVPVEVALYSRFQIANGGWAAPPTFDGFWSEKVFDADRFDFQRRTLNGKVFAVSTLKKAVLIPLSPDSKTIPPMAFNVAIPQSPRDFFDFGTTQNLKIESKPVTLQILPLPENGRPKEFTGGVGQFTMSAALDRAATSNSEPINLTVKVSGTGNIRMIDKPPIEPVAGLRILDPEMKDDARVAGETVRGTKTFRFPIIPQSDGKFVIAPIRIAYFDPQAKAYRTLSSERLEFSASGSANAATPIVENSGLKVLGSDIDYIKPDATVLRASAASPPAWPNVLYVLSVGLLAGSFWYRGHSARLASDRGYARKSRSSGLVRRRLRQAETLLAKKDERGFYAALGQAVVGYVGDRFNIEAQALTRDRLRDELERHQVAPETTSRVLEIVDQCETARFAPGQLAGRDPRDLFESARQTLGRI